MCACILLQGGNTSSLSSRVTTIESKLLEILQSCNENAKSIQSLESIILAFMRQFQSIGANVGSLGLRGHASILGQNLAHIVGNNIIFERKGKNLVAKFDASDAHDGLVGCKCVVL